MSILIRGIEMPKEYGRCMVIFPDGRVTTEFGSLVIANAVPVPPHGRLVDADKMIWRLTPNEEFYPTEADRFEYDNGRLMVRDIRSFIRDQPTVIPAEPLKEEE